MAIQRAVLLLLSWLVAAAPLATRRPSDITRPATQPTLTGKKHVQRELVLDHPAGTPGRSSAHKFETRHASVAMDFTAFDGKFGLRVHHAETELSTAEIFVALDADGDQRVDKEELRGFRALAPDGDWDVAEFSHKFGHHLRGKDPELDLQASFEALDADGDGRLGGAEKNAVNTLLLAGTAGTKRKPIDVWQEHVFKQHVVGGRAKQASEL